MERGKPILFVAATVLAALSLASIVGVALHTLHWFWTALSVAALAFCLTATTRRKFALPARGAVVAALVSVFVVSALTYTAPVEVESQTMVCNSPADCRVVGTIEVNQDCVWWTDVRVTFYNSKYRVNGSPYTRQATGHQYFGAMQSGDTAQFLIEFPGGFEPLRYRVYASALDGERCDLTK